MLIVRYIFQKKKILTHTYHSRQYSLDKRGLFSVILWCKFLHRSRLVKNCYCPVIRIGKKKWGAGRQSDVAGHILHQGKSPKSEAFNSRSFQFSDVQKVAEILKRYTINCFFWFRTWMPAPVEIFP